MDKKKALLLKLKALAERGEGGEKLNAEAMLEKLMREYGYSAQELESEEKNECIFRYRTSREKWLLWQIIYKVTDENSTPFFKRGKEQNKARSVLTVEQQMEVELLFDFYRRLYKKEEKSFYGAFIQKHGLFGKLRDEEPPMELSIEERRKQAAIAAGMDDASPNKQITWSG